MGCSQNHFPLISRRESWFAAIAVGILFFGDGAIQAQDTSDLVLQLRANVVRIEVPNLRNAENGFGFIVGQRSGQIYIVTAQHVIVPNDEPGVTAPTRVKVMFYSDQGKTYDAEVLGTHDTPHDLAVLRLPAPNGLTWIKESLAGAEMQRRGAHVWFIGRNSNWFVPVDPGVINSEHPTDDWRVEIERLPVRPGSSGGPLVAGTGIVAMVQRGNEDDSFALTIDFIKTKMQDWNYPWDLVSARAAAQSLPPPTDIPTPSKDRPATQPPVVQPPVERPPTDGSITLRYTGDYAGCLLLLNVKIGNRSSLSQSNPHPMVYVPLGNQTYVIRGTIGCAGGSCSATGAGQINVVDGSIYDAVWKNTGAGQCTVVLNPARF
jgi:hypothetical protein